MQTPPMPHALPFFLDAAGGELFCMYHAPASGAPLLGAILYVPPFADELNKCRRMAALQAREFVAHGYAVLQIDLWGCGDSAGEFAEARWERWLSDLDYGWQWLVQHAPAPIYLWGVRLGALLALHFASQAKPAPAGALLWQAELDGAAYLTGLQRLQRLGELFNSGTLVENAHAADQQEIGGYRLHPDLILSLQQAARPAPPRFPVCWLEFVSPPQPPVLRSESRRALEDWQRHGQQISQHALVGAAFWSANEVLVLPEAFALGVAGLREMQS